jgi:hypothetical protein
LRSISQNALRKKPGKPGKKQRAVDFVGHPPSRDRLAIPYHNNNTAGPAAAAAASLAAQTPSDLDQHSTSAVGGDGPPGIFHDLQLDSPPVLFIRKYGQLIDTQHVILKDQLTDMEKDVTLLTPQTLTHAKIRMIQEAVRRSPTFEKLTQSFVHRRTPVEAPLSPAVSDGLTGTAALKRSVFTDSDFENIR